MTDHEGLEALRREISRDLEPVRPIRLERRVPPLIVLMSLALGAALFAFLGPRWDYPRLGSSLGLGLSVLELGASLTILGLGLRQWVPGRWTSPTLLALAAGAAALLHLLTTRLTFQVSRVPVPPDEIARRWLFCFSFEAVLGISVLLAVLWKSRHGLPLSLGLAGLWSGVSAGLAGDAIWRLFCPYTVPVHTLPAHGGGALAVAACGAAVGVLWGRARLRRWSARRFAGGDL